MIEVEIDIKQVALALDRLSSASANPRPALLAIGESLLESTKKRFETSTAPDGTKWKPNAAATYLGIVRGLGKSNFGKSGRLNKRGAERVSGKKPLIGASHSLSQQISYSVDAEGLHLGSPMEYAAMQQFGGTKSKFPHLWGDIPARPFLGVSDSDEQMIWDTVSDYLKNAIG